MLQLCHLTLQILLKIIWILFGCQTFYCSSAGKMFNENNIYIYTLAVLYFNVFVSKLQPPELIFLIQLSQCKPLILEQYFVWQAYSKCTAWADTNIMSLLLHQASQHYSAACLQITNSPGGSDSCLSQKEKTPDCSEKLRWGTHEHGHFPTITSLPESSGRLIKEMPLWLWHTSHTYCMLLIGHLSGVAGCVYVCVDIHM